jgi:hypothetical protein
MNILQIIDSTKKHKGLGDTVKAVTKAVGVKPCGSCNKRAEKLNKLVSYRKG